LDNRHGVLVIDKPAGPTSHDVVARLRRVLDTRAVGHAGTLDPAATGVLVVVVGEGTKLTPYLSAEDKSYETTVSFGKATDTLDAEGTVVAEAPIPPPLARDLAALATRNQAEGPVAAALAAERTRREQVPPAFSAIKVAGRPAYRQARQGEPVDLAPRPVEIHALDVISADATALTLRLVVSKGYYVRALARDLGSALGVPAHLSMLRRTRSGGFALEEAVRLSDPPEKIAAAVQPLATCVGRVLPVAHLKEGGAQKARFGQKLDASDFDAPPREGHSAWLAPSGELVAIGLATNGLLRVERGFGQGSQA
jgi:tRNA pseudouridine55 synthase